GRDVLIAAHRDHGLPAGWVGELRVGGAAPAEQRASHRGAPQGRSRRLRAAPTMEARPAARYGGDERLGGARLNKTACSHLKLLGRGLAVRAKTGWCAKN